MKYGEILEQTGVSPQRAGQIYNKVMYEKEMFERPFDPESLEIPYTMSVRALRAVKDLATDLRTPSWLQLSKTPLNRLRSVYKHYGIGKKTAEEIESFMKEKFPKFREMLEEDAKTPKTTRNRNPDSGFEGTLTSVELIVWRGRCKSSTKRPYKNIMNDTGETQETILEMENHLDHKFRHYNTPFDPMIFERPYGLSPKAWNALKSIVNDWFSATYLTYDRVSSIPRIEKETIEEISNFLPSIFPRFDLKTNIDDRTRPGDRINPMTYDFNGPSNSPFNENALNCPYGLRTHTVVMVHNAGYRRWKSAAETNFNVFRNMIRDYRDLRSVIELKIFLSQKFPDQHNMNW